MLKNCYKMCTSCFSPYRIGNDAVAGESLAVTSSYTVVLPYEFTATGRLTQFSAFFATVNPVRLQVFRPNGSNSYSPIYDQLVVPQAAYQAQDIKVRECIIVNATDRIGMTSFSGPSSVAHTMSDEFSSIDIREAAAVGQGFFSVGVPFVFSLSAEFTLGTAC
jgi:hypothetical protein